MMTSLTSFVCQQCGACCRVPGYVTLEPGETEKIAAYLKMPLHAFTAEYTKLTFDREALSLTELADNRCVFLQDDNSCRIQPVKPTQCRGFPFLWRTPILEQICPAWQACKEELNDEH